MSRRDKQMRALVPLLFDKICKIDSIYHDLAADKMLSNVEAYEIAELITDTGYRKESEVLGEIAELIEKSAIGNFTLGTEFIIIPKIVLNAIKENCAGGEGNDR